MHNKSVEIRELLKDIYSLDLELIAGEKGLAKAIYIPKIQKKGLAFAGLIETLADDRILIVGNTEIQFFNRFTDHEIDNIVDNIFQKRIPCVIFTNNNLPNKSFIKICNRYNVALLKTSIETSRFIPKITKVLEDFITQVITYHGVLIDIFGLGVLIEGDSGIGKSELALEMILKGHRFIADDIVVMKFFPPNLIVGSSPKPLKGHLEIRGLGIINVAELYGISSLRAEKKIGMVIRLTKEMEEIDRIGLNKEKKEILGVKLPYLKIPIINGRNISILVETAVRLHLLKDQDKTDKTSTEKFLEKLYG